MYDANKTYEENYTQGPFAHLLPHGEFPKLRYTQEPRFVFLGQKLHIPLGIPAGPLLHSGYMEVALQAGFSMPTYKTVRTRPWDSHPWPNVLSVHVPMENFATPLVQGARVVANTMSNNDYGSKDISITNSFGVPSQHPDVWVRDHALLRGWPGNGYAPVLSFQPSPTLDGSEQGWYEDLSKVVSLACQALGQSGGVFLEINLSCPNEKKEPLYKDMGKSQQVLRCVFEQLQSCAPQVKLLAKIGVLDDAGCFGFLQACGPYLHGVSAINTLSCEVRDAQGNTPLAHGLRGGVCGRLIYKEGLAMVARLAAARDCLGLSSLGLVGVGGVFSVEDVQAYLRAGADVVQAATGAMWNLSLAQEVAEALGVPCVKEKGEQNGGR